MFCITMTTIQRKNKYLHLEETLSNLKSSGFFESEILKESEFHLFDGGSPDTNILKTLNSNIKIHETSTKITAFENFIRCIEIAKNSKNLYWLHLQDDIKVSEYFLESVYNFINKFSNSFDAFSFYTPYNEITECYKKAKEYWIQEGRKYYGILAFALNSKHIDSVLNFFKNKHKDSLDDITMQQWLIANDLNVCCSVPSIVQHIGIVSSNGNRPERICPCFDIDFQIFG